MKLSLHSVTFHDSPVAVREALAPGEALRHTMLRKMHAEPEVGEALLLETCNRLEFYLYTKRAFDVTLYLTGLYRELRPEAAPLWTRYHKQIQGEDVIRHLFSVASGLDSQMIGENQILSQVKTAYTESVQCRTSKIIFHRLLHHAFRIGKAVRTQTNINCGAVSIALTAVAWARSQCDLSRTRALIIGAGENAELIGRYLAKGPVAQLIIANRDKHKAETLAASLPSARAIDLAEIGDWLGRTDLVISSTASLEPVLTYDTARAALQGRDRPVTMIDIAVPRDIEPEVGTIDGVTLKNIDDLHIQIDRNRRIREQEIPKAQRIVDQYTETFLKWYHSLNVVPVITDLTDKTLRLARKEARRYARDFAAQDRDKLAAFAESLVKKVLHHPIHYIKRSGDDPSSEQLQALEVINAMFDLQEQDPHA
jgi:glutamyl-tRNA reductase